MNVSGEINHVLHMICTWDATLISKILEPRLDWDWTELDWEPLGWFLPPFPFPLPSTESYSFSIQVTSRKGYYFFSQIWNKCYAESRLLIRYIFSISCFHAWFWQQLIAFFLTVPTTCTTKKLNFKLEIAPGMGRLQAAILHAKTENHRRLVWIKACARESNPNV